MLNQVFGQLEQPRTLVLGLGESGLAMAQWLAHQGAAVVRVADTRQTPPALQSLNGTVPQAIFVAGELNNSLLDDCDLVVVSPGLSPLQNEMAALLLKAQELQIPVWGEIELFARALSALKEATAYDPRVIAITGTNGKTTTTSLTGLLCERAGKRVAVAGNISPAALTKLTACLDANELPDVWVLELSSFQLEMTYSLNAHAATILNITQDHLDWHGSMGAYAQAKSHIFGPQTIPVLNRDDDLVMQFAKPGAISFGLDEPLAVNDFGLLKENGLQWLVLAVPSEEPTTRKRGKQIETVPFMIQKLMPANALKIRGLHNAANALAALALCRAIDLPMAKLLHSLREYEGEPHRVQWVATINEVEYYDDSKGTNVGATVAALNGLAKPVVLIAGGDGKGQDFAPLLEPVQRYAHTVCLIGKDASAIRAALSSSTAELLDCSTLEEAVALAAGKAKRGDAVLLSPACASLDMFKNYAHRAEVFVEAVKSVGLEAGVML